MNKICNLSVTSKNSSIIDKLKYENILINNKLNKEYNFDIDSYLDNRVNNNILDSLSFLLNELDYNTDYFVKYSKHNTGSVNNNNNNNNSKNSSSSKNFFLKTITKDNQLTKSNYCSADIITDNYIYYISKVVLFERLIKMLDTISLKNILNLNNKMFHNISNIKVCYSLLKNTRFNKIKLQLSKYDIAKCTNKDYPLKNSCCLLPKDLEFNIFILLKGKLELHLIEKLTVTLTYKEFKNLLIDLEKDKRIYELENIILLNKNRFKSISNINLITTSFNSIKCNYIDNNKKKSFITSISNNNNNSNDFITKRNTNSNINNNNSNNNYNYNYYNFNTNINRKSSINTISSNLTKKKSSLINCLSYVINDLDIYIKSDEESLKLNNKNNAVINGEQFTLIKTKKIKNIKEKDLFGNSFNLTNLQLNNMFSNIVVRQCYDGNNTDNEAILLSISKDELHKNYSNELNKMFNNESINLIKNYFFYNQDKEVFIKKYFPFIKVNYMNKGEYLYKSTKKLKSIDFLLYGEVNIIIKTNIFNLYSVKEYLVNLYNYYLKHFKTNLDNKDNINLKRKKFENFLINNKKYVNNNNNNNNINSILNNKTNNKNNILYVYLEKLLPNFYLNKLLNSSEVFYIQLVSKSDCLGLIELINSSHKFLFNVEIKSTSALIYSIPNNIILNNLKEDVDFNKLYNIYENKLNCYIDRINDIINSKIYYLKDIILSNTNNNNINNINNTNNLEEYLSNNNNLNINFMALKCDKYILNNNNYSKCNKFKIESRIDNKMSKTNLNNKLSTNKIVNLGLLNTFINNKSTINTEVSIFK